MAGESRGCVLLIAGAGVLLASCGTPASHRESADRTAGRIIAEKQLEALGREEPFTIEKPSETLRTRFLKAQGLPVTDAVSLGSARLDRGENWPEPVVTPHVERYLPEEEGREDLRLALLDALQVGARNSREYQSRKEEVFRRALALDLERDEFRGSYAWLLESFIGSSGQSGSTVADAGGSTEGSVIRRLRSGAELTGLIALDIVKLLTQEGSSSLGVLADATVSIPLLRGSGRHVAAEPLTQAERDVRYAIWEFERFKKTFAVEIAIDYLSVLLGEREVANAEQNYRGLVASTRRARRLAEAGRLPWFQFDQSLQNELRARDRWIRARKSRERQLDAFKVALGLPADAHLELDPEELEGLEETARLLMSPGEPETASARVPPADAPVVLEEPEREREGYLGMEETDVLALALNRRLDLLVALGRVHDARRGVAVAADALRGEMTLFGTATAGERRGTGSAGQPDAEVNFDEGNYSALLTLDLPLERTAERNAYRESHIRLEEAVRNLQGLEDQVKLEVRNRLRSLLESREGIVIQHKAVEIAERRVKSTDLFLQAGRADVRDVLESSEALLSARNALAASLVDYRIAELELQRDLGVLEVNAEGLWEEHEPEETDNGDS
jgi:outer membrane protein TolC